MNFAEEIAQLKRQVQSLQSNQGSSLRFGHVTGIEESGFCRVKLVDGQNMVTKALPTIQRRVLKDQEIKLPDIGEPVAVLFSGKGLEHGVILGALYSENVQKPNEENHVEYKKFSDGTIIRYDREKSLLEMEFEKDVNILVKNTVEISIEKESNIECPIIKIKGDIELDGNLHATGDIVAGTVSLRQHVHTKTMPGAGLSGIPLGG